MAKQEYHPIIIDTPGELLFVVISGKGVLKYKSKTEYEYKASIRLKGEAAQKAIASIQTIIDSYNPLTKRGHVGYKAVFAGRREDGREKFTLEHPDKVPADHNDWLFTFKTGVVNQEGKPVHIPVFNAASVPVILDHPIGIGSEGCLGGLAALYDDGHEYNVSLYLTGVQLTKYVPFMSAPNFSAKQIDESDSYTTEQEAAGQAPTPSVRL